MTTPCTGHAAESERDEWMVSILERLHHHSLDTNNTAFARSTMFEAADYIRSGVPATAEVPMPEPMGTRFDGTRLLKESDVRTYGDAREAAGYARGRAESDKLAHTLAMCRETFKKYADMHAAKGTDEGREKAEANMRIVSICDAALRGEVK